MNIDEIYAGDALKAQDLKGKEATRIISGVELAEFDQGPDKPKERKPRLLFNGTKKTLVLNKTNATAIASMYGPDTDNWIGKKVTLIPTQTDYQGRIMPCIRVKIDFSAIGNSSQAPIASQYPTQQEQQHKNNAFEEPPMNQGENNISQQLDDDIPF